LHQSSPKFVNDLRDVQLYFDALGSLKDLLCLGIRFLIKVGDRFEK